MLCIISIICGVAAGILAGGKISNLRFFKLNKIPLVLIAFAIQLCAQVVSARGVVPPQAFNIGIYALSYIMLLYAFWSNKKYVGVVTIGLGSLLNAVVILVNGGKMPVSLEALERAGLDKMADMLVRGADSKHSLLNENTYLGFLSDIIHIPGFPGIMMGIVSIGDLLIMIGLFILTYEVIKGERCTK